MAFLPQVFTIPPVVSATSLTPGLAIPGNYLYMYLVVPTMAAGYSSASTPIYVRGSLDGITYYRYSNPENNTSTVGANDFTVQSSVSQRIVNIPNFSYPYIQLEVSGTATSPAAANVFKLVCISNQ